MSIVSNYNIDNRFTSLLFFLADGQWGGLCKWGKCQSPIVLSKCRSTEFYFGPLLFYNYDTPLGYLLVSNNGHGGVYFPFRFLLRKIQFLYFPKVSIDIPEILKISISGGPLASEYALVNIHWHWDRTEHIIAGQRYFTKKVRETTN